MRGASTSRGLRTHPHRLRTRSGAPSRYRRCRRPASLWCVHHDTAHSRLFTHHANTWACHHHSPRHTRARMPPAQAEVVQPGGRGRAGRGGARLPLMHPGLARVLRCRGQRMGERWLRATLEWTGMRGAHARWGVAQPAQKRTRGWSGAGGPVTPGLHKGEGGGISVAYPLPIAAPPSLLRATVWGNGRTTEGGVSTTPRSSLVQGSCTRDDAGSCSHTMREGPYFPSAPPPPGSRVALGLCTAPLLAMRAGLKGGIPAWTPFAWHPRTPKEGGPVAPPVLPAPILAASRIAPVRAPLPVHAQMGRRFSAPCSRRQGGGRRGEAEVTLCAGVSMPR